MKSVHFTFRRKHIIRNNDVISHLESSFSFSKHFALLFGSHKNSVKLCDSKSLYFTHEETEARMWMMCPYCLTQGLHHFILAFTVYNNSLFLTFSPAFVLCHTTLLNLFISSDRVFFFLHSLCFYMYEIMSSANKDNFTSAFLVWILSFSCLITLAVTSRTVLNSSG